MTDSKQVSVAVLIATGNQREKSVSAVKQIWAMKPANWNIRIYFVDLGSVDGTIAAIESLGLNLKLIQGNSSWRGGRAIREAQDSIDEAFDVMLLVRDDINVFPDTYMRLEEYRAQYPNSILVTQLNDPSTGELTFGGCDLEPGLNLQFTHVESQRLPMDVDTFDGHLVLIPFESVALVGSFNASYSRVFAERDFGLRATQKRIRVLVLPGFFGTSARTPEPILKTRRDRLRYLHTVVGQAPMVQLRFLVRHSKLRWPLQFFAPYLRILLQKTL